MHQLYLKKILLTLILLFLPICGNWLFLFNHGELLPIDLIVEKQFAQKSFSLVGLATRNQGYYYKKALFLKQKPYIFVHGSSRVMQFKEEFFTKPMFNSGGSMSSVNEGWSFIKEVFAKHQPKIMILGIDYWWFSKSFVVPSATIKPPIQLSNRITLRSYLLPYKWLWEKKISFKYYFKMMDPFLIFEEKHHLGVDAVLNNTGYAKDGSYLYTKIVTGKEKSQDAHFQKTLKLVKNNQAVFQNGMVIDPIHFENFLNMLKFIEECNIKIILFIPPIAPTIANELNDFSLIKDLRKKLSAANIKYYDFHEIISLHSTDCEFIDGTHGGEVLYAKILQNMAKYEQALREHVNMDYLKLVINNYQDLAVIPKKQLANLEVDFLQIGCDKSKQHRLLNQHTTGVLPSG